MTSAEREVLGRLADAPLDDFVATRKAIAAELRAAGERELAAWAAARPKPTPAVWAANHLARHEHAAVTRLLGAAETLRGALGGDGADVAAAQRSFRDAVEGATATAFDALSRSAARRPSATIRERLRATLTSAAAQPALADQLRDGLLEDEPEPAAFGEVGVAARPVARPAARSSSARVAAEATAEKERKARRKAQLADARAELRAAKAAEASIARELDRAHERVLAAETALARLERDGG